MLRLIVSKDMCPYAIMIRHVEGLSRLSFAPLGGSGSALGLTQRQRPRIPLPPAVSQFSTADSADKKAEGQCSCLVPVPVQYAA